MDSQTDNIRVLITLKKIAAVVKSLAGEITRDYHDKRPLLVGVLKGSFIFLADLVRQLDFPLEVDFIQLTSYGSGKENTGMIEVDHDLRTNIAGRHVLLVEDIIDTGITASYLLGVLGEREPASLKLCTLMDKPSRRRVPVKIDYAGLTVPDRFVVGYGLDNNEEYRHFPHIGYLED